MASLEEVYQEILASDEERRAFAQVASDEQTIMGYLAQRGCEVTPQEAHAFMQEKLAQTRELSSAELADASGGALCGKTPNHICPKCGSQNTYEVPDKSFTCICRACGETFTWRPPTTYSPI